MKPSVVKLLHISLSVCPDRQFIILGQIQSIERLLKVTNTKIRVVDRTKSEDNVSVFRVVFRDEIKSLFDRICSVQDLLHISGNLMVDSDGRIELDAKYFLAFDGLKNVFDTSVTAIPTDEFDPTRAY